MCLHCIFNSTDNFVTTVALISICAYSGFGTCTLAVREVCAGRLVDMTMILLWIKARIFLLVKWQSSIFIGQEHSVKMVTIDLILPNKLHGFPSHSERTTLHIITGISHIIHFTNTKRTHHVELTNYLSAFIQFCQNLCFHQSCHDLF
jgi:hypothetical protein